MTSRWIAIFAAAFASMGAAAGCSSGPSAAPDPEVPAWTRQPARTVESGYIVFVGTALARSPEQAQFRADSAAIQDVANECSFAPKGTRLEDRYQDTSGVLYRSYAKVAVAFEECEAAQRAIEPEAIRKLANVALAEQVKRYQQALDDEEGEDESETVAQASPMPAPSPVPGATAAPPIYDPVRFFVVRQQITYAKEVVILSPPTAYAPSSPESVHFVQVIRPTSDRAFEYRASHPALKNDPMTWSTLPSRPAVPPLAGVRGSRSSRRAVPTEMRRMGNRQGVRRWRSSGDRAPAPGYAPPRRKKRRKRY